MKKIKAYYNVDNNDEKLINNIIENGCQVRKTNVNHLGKNV